jgi:hypothetical protein
VDQLHDLDAAADTVLPPPPPPATANSSTSSSNSNNGSNGSNNNLVPYAAHHPSPIGANPIWVPKTMISIQVIRAWGLPVHDILGAANPYAVFDWNVLGRASTQAVHNTAAPAFGATLQFRSPFELLGEGANAASSSPSPPSSPSDPSDDEYSVSYSARERKIALGGKTYKCSTDAGLMRVYVYSRNESVSDELLGFAEFDPLPLLMDEQASTLHLVDRQQAPAGCVELFARVSV